MKGPLLVRRQIGAGVDPETGHPVLILEGLEELGYAAPDQRYLIAPNAAMEVAAALLVAADPALLPLLLGRLTLSQVEKANRAVHSGGFDEVGAIARDLQAMIARLEEVARVAEARREQSQPAATPEHECG